MSKHGLLGAFEELVLLAVAHLDDEAYGMKVRREIERRSGREVAIGAVYATLERMESKGFLSSRTVEGGSDRRGRPRKFFLLQPSGVRALLDARRLHDNMWDGLDAAALQRRQEASQ